MEASIAPLSPAIVPGGGGFPSSTMPVSVAFFHEGGGGFSSAGAKVFIRSVGLDLFFGIGSRCLCD